MKRTAFITTLALTGTIALAPFAAFAEDSVESNTSLQVHSKQGFLRGGLDVTERASTTHAEHEMKHADTAIDARISLLQKLSTRIEGMKRVSADKKTALSTELSTQIASLTALMAKIEADTSTSTHKDDKNGIAPDYGTYAFLAPQAAITASADRVLNITVHMNDVAQKLAVRISEAKTAGKNMIAADTAYVSYQAKIANATLQANAAIALVNDVKVDNGDATVRASNTAALKNARAKLKTAENDLTAARADLKTITTAVKGTGVRAHASSTRSS